MLHKRFIMAYAIYDSLRYIFFMEKSVMCVGGSSSPVVQTVGPRDTSNEMIVSDYKLSEANKKKNAEIRARNKAKSLVAFSGGGDDDNTGAGVTFSGSSYSSNSNGSGFSDASGGFRT